MMLIGYSLGSASKAGDYLVNIPIFEYGTKVSVNQPFCKINVKSQSDIYRYVKEHLKAAQSDEKEDNT